MKADSFITVLGVGVAAYVLVRIIQGSGAPPALPASASPYTPAASTDPAIIQAVNTAMQAVSSIPGFM